MEPAREPLMIFRPLADETACAKTVVSHFSAAHLPCRKLKEKNWNLYRVYKNAEEFVEVEGEAVYEAMAKSGVARPFKIQRALKELGSVLTPAFFSEATEEAPTAPKSDVPDSGVIAPPAANSAN